MELAEPGLATYLRALKNALHRIDSFWELPDHIKDQRKFEVFGDLLGEIAGYHDDELVRRMGQIMVADGLEPMMVMLVSDGAIERARLAVEWREQAKLPKEPKLSATKLKAMKIAYDQDQSLDKYSQHDIDLFLKVKFNLPKSVMDAIDWLIAHNPGGYDAFVEGRPHEELSAIEAYLNEKRGNRND